MTKYLLIIPMLMLTACYESYESNKATGDALTYAENERHRLFVECMDLAAKMPRQSDDDVSDIVEECSSQSFYMTNHLRWK